MRPMWLAMQVHPGLEPFFGLAIRAKAKAGDDAGAEALKHQYLKV